MVRLGSIEVSGISGELFCGKGKDGTPFFKYSILVMGGTIDSYCDELLAEKVKGIKAGTQVKATYDIDLRQNAKAFQDGRAFVNQSAGLTLVNVLSSRA